MTSIVTLVLLLVVIVPLFISLPTHNPNANINTTNDCSCYHDLCSNNNNNNNNNHDFCRTTTTVTKTVHPQQLRPPTRSQSVTSGFLVDGYSMIGVAKTTQTTTTSTTDHTARMRRLRSSSLHDQRKRVKHGNHRYGGLYRNWDRTPQMNTNDDDTYTDDNGRPIPIPTTVATEVRTIPPPSIDTTTATATSSISTISAKTSSILDIDGILSSQNNNEYSPRTKGNDTNVEFDSDTVIVDIDGTDDDDDDDDNNNDYHIRFRGIGRLYTSTAGTSSSSKNGVKENETTNTADEERRTQADLDTVTTTTATVLHRLQNAVVVVVGVGGVGSWAVEALGRSGVGTIVLIDMDDICSSNINRQLHAMSNTIGNMKIDVLYQRLIQINPNCTVHRIYDFITIDTIYDMFDTIIHDWGQQKLSSLSSSVARSDHNDNDNHILHNGTTKTLTAVLDCIDGAREKAALIAYCNHRSIPICTVGSTAGRTNPAKVTVGDLTNVYTSSMGHSSDRLLTSVRKELRQEYNFIPGRPFGRKSEPWNVPCVYSEEEVIVPRTSQQQMLDRSNIATAKTTTAATTSSFRQCDNGVLGTASFVTGTFGFIAASIIVQGIARNELHPPHGTNK